MTPTRSQLDAAEAWLLEEWRARVSDQRHEGFVDFGSRDRDAWLEARGELATAIRAIRAQRKALDAAPAKVWVAHFPSPSGTGFDVFATRDAAEHAASFCDGATVEEREVRP